MQTGLGATEPTEVKFACPVISFVVVLSALSFCSGTLTSHHFMLSNLGQVVTATPAKTEAVKGHGIHFLFKNMAFEHSLGWSYGLIKMVMVVLYLLSNSSAQIKISVTFDVVKEFRM